MRFDHHNGKRVESISNAEGEATITFEGGDTIKVPGELPTSLVGQSLLMVEEGQLIFGFTRPDAPAVRQTEISHGDQQDEPETVEAPKPKRAGRSVKARAAGGRQSRSKGKNA